MLQYRPTEGTVPDRLYYSPARDLANCGVGIITAAMTFLEEDINAGKFTFSDFTIEDLEAAVEKLGKAVSNILEKTDQEALLESGFLDCDPAIINTVLSYIGKALIYSTYIAIKDVHCLGDKPPLAVEDFINQINEYHKQIVTRTIMRKTSRAFRKVKDLCLRVINAVRESLDSLTDMILNKGP